MTTSNNIELTWILEDEDLEADELESLVQNLSRQALNIVEDVNRVKLDTDSTPKDGFTTKGEGSKSGILNVEINLENIAKFVTWLHERLTGKMAEATIEYGAAKVSFKVNNQKDLAQTLKDAEHFIAAIKALENNHV
jgi:hypothetical protein